jgi:hypothetical protein
VAVNRLNRQPPCGIKIARSRTIATHHGRKVAKKSVTVIRIAIRVCLIRCRASDAPLAELGDYAEELAAVGWDSDSVRTFEQGVLAELVSDHRTSASA